MSDMRPSSMLLGDGGGAHQVSVGFAGLVGGLGGARRLRGLPTGVPFAASASGR